METSYMAMPGMDKKEVTRIIAGKRAGGYRIVDPNNDQFYKNQIEKITRVTSGVLWIPYHLIKKKRRYTECVVPRQIAQYFCVKEKIPLNTIANAFYIKSHATIINSVKQVNNMIDTDKSKRHIIAELQELLTKIK